MKTLKVLLLKVFILVEKVQDMLAALSRQEWMEKDVLKCVLNIYLKSDNLNK